MPKNVNYLGRRPAEDLFHIPRHYWPHHEYCFYLHDQLAALLVEYDAAGAHQWIADTIARVAAEKGVEGDLDVLDILKKAGMTETGKHLLQLKTEDLNINLIFNNAASDHLYDVAYKALPYLMLFLVQLALRAFSEIVRTNVATTNHLVLVSLGAFECLQTSGPRPMSKLVTKMLKGTLNCLHCKKPLKLDRGNAMSLFLTEQVTCAGCGLVSQVPLYWLLAQAGLKITPDEPLSAYDKVMREVGFTEGT